MLATIGGEEGEGTGSPMELDRVRTLLLHPSVTSSFAKTHVALVDLHHDVERAC